ncbi:hypothetical protein DFJ73DRAFT_898945 [Zopfochytrium polystomum]|nr:hypothetical protein DFJ73DRAFT_898945 [Zopfochytrium polystomum]
MPPPPPQHATLPSAQPSTYAADVVEKLLRERIAKCTSPTAVVAAALALPTSPIITSAPSAVPLTYATTFPINQCTVAAIQRLASSKLPVTNNNLISFSSPATPIMLLTETEPGSPSPPTSFAQTGHRPQEHLPSPPDLRKYDLSLLDINGPLPIGACPSPPPERAHSPKRAADPLHTSITQGRRAPNLPSSTASSGTPSGEQISPAFHRQDPPLSSAVDPPENAPITETQSKASHVTGNRPPPQPPAATPPLRPSRLPSPTRIPQPQTRSTCKVGLTQQSSSRVAQPIPSGGRSQPSTAQQPPTSASAERQLHLAQPEQQPPPQSHYRAQQRPSPSPSSPLPSDAPLQAPPPTTPSQLPDNHQRQHPARAPPISRRAPAATSAAAAAAAAARRPAAPTRLREPQSRCRPRAAGASIAATAATAPEPLASAGPAQTATSATASAAETPTAPPPPPLDRSPSGNGRRTQYSMRPTTARSSAAGFNGGGCGSAAPSRAGSVAASRAQSFSDAGGAVSATAPGYGDGSAGGGARAADVAAAAARWRLVMEEAVARLVERVAALEDISKEHQRLLLLHGAASSAGASAPTVTTDCASSPLATANGRDEGEPPGNCLATALGKRR